MPETFPHSAVYTVGVVWINIPRPPKWNGKTMRSLPVKPKSAQPLSLRAYLESAGKCCPPVPKSSYDNYVDVCHFLKSTVVFRFMLVALPTSALPAGLWFRAVERGKGQADFSPPLVFSIVWIILSISLFHTATRRETRLQDTCATPLIADPRIILSDASAQDAIQGSGWESAKRLREKVALGEDIPDRTVKIMRGLVQHIRERQVTEAKDRSYALNGILRTIEVEPPEVDYSLTLGEVYRQLLSTLLRWEPALISMLIDATATSRPSADAPSWVPDWGSIGARSWLHTSYVYNTCSQRATPSSAPCALVSGGRLTVRGTIYDASRSCSGPLREFRDDDIVPSLSVYSAAGRAILDFVSWVSAARRDIRLENAFESLPRAIFDVLAGPLTKAGTGSIGGDDSGPGSGAKSDTMKSFNEWYQIFSDATTRSAGGSRPLAPRNSRIDSATSVRAVATALADNPAAKHFFTQCCAEMMGRRSVFFTRKRYIGTGPEGMRSNDCIALVAGVPAPMVLRAAITPNGAEYSVLGPALIPALMNGEGWDEAKAEDIILV